MTRPQGRVALFVVLVTAVLVRALSDKGLAAVYGASKAAIAMLTVQYAKALPDFKVNAAEPGFADTDFTAGFDGGAPPQETVKVVVRLATLGPEGPTGTFEENAGHLAW